MYEKTAITKLHACLMKVERYSKKVQARKIGKHDRKERKRRNYLPSMNNQTACGRKEINKTETNSIESTVVLVGYARLRGSTKRKRPFLYQVLSHVSRSNK